jgi:DNA-binding protein H-NS
MKAKTLQIDWEKKQEQKFLQEKIAEQINEIQKLFNGREPSPLPANFVLVGRQIYDILITLQENESVPTSRKTRKRAKRNQFDIRQNTDPV